MQQTSAATDHISERLKIVSLARNAAAMRATELAGCVCAHSVRSEADVLASEILPLLEAMRFLEREAPRILAAKKHGAHGRPLWLTGLHSEVQRVPFGTVLVVGPSNYPLLLPGIQVLQAWVASNRVIWKPGTGGRPIADLFVSLLHAAGVPRDQIVVTNDSVEAVYEAIDNGVDKVVFTGSSQAGRTLLSKLAERNIPCIAELSGCDAFILLPDADLHAATQALAFGMRLNGSATCMAPRRVLLVDASDERKQMFLGTLQASLQQIAEAPISQATLEHLQSLSTQAIAQGAELSGNIAERMRPVLFDRVTPQMQIAQADIFAPVLLLIDVAREEGVLAAQQACPYALTASIFGSETHARRLAEKLDVGSVLINDVIVGTADPRLPFGGHRSSGYGLTRGAEGLLEMTAARVISTQRSKDLRRFAHTSLEHAELFAALAQVQHARGIAPRVKAVAALVRAVQKIATLSGKAAPKSKRS